MVDESTTNKHYPLPHPSNIESQDVTRIATAISMIDSDVTSCLNSVETMNSVVSGLETKALKIPNELVGQVDTSLSNIIAGRYIVVNEDATGFSTVEGGGGEGGKKGEVLIKRSDANFDTTWLDPRTILKKAPIIKETETDVQLSNNCTMILEDAIDTEADDVPRQGLSPRQINSDATADSTCSYILCDTVDDTVEDESDIATTEKFGRVKIGTGVNVNNGVISVPVIGLASTEDFGMVRVGSGLNIEDGVVSTQPYPHADSETFGLVKPGSDFYFDSRGALNIVKRNRDIIYQSMATNVVNNGVIEIVPTCAHYRAVVDDDILFSFDWGDFVPDDDVAFELEIVSDGTHLIAFDTELNPTMSAIPLNRGTTKISFKKKLGIPYYDIEVSRLDAPEPVLLTPNYGDNVTSELLVWHNGSSHDAHNLLTAGTSNLDFAGRELYLEFGTLVVVDYIYYTCASPAQALGEFYLQGSNDKTNWTTLLYKNGEAVNGNIYTETKGCYKYYKLYIGWLNSNYPRSIQLYGTKLDNNESELVLLTPTMSSNTTSWATISYSNLHEGSAANVTSESPSTYVYIKYSSTDATDLTRWIKYEFTSPTVANFLDVCSHGDNLNRSMRWYKLEGSNDGETWTLLLERQYQRDFYKYESRYHEFDNTTAYIFYRLTCLETGTTDEYWKIGRFRLFRRDARKHNFYRSVPKLSSANQDGYVITASSQYNDGHAGYLAFDDNTQTRWASVADEGNSWLQIKLPTAMAFNTAKIAPRGDGCIDQAPSTFQIQGSNDGENWDVLDSETGISWATLGELRSFQFENETTYLYYRLYITANQGSAYNGCSCFILGNTIREYKRYLNKYEYLVPAMSSDSQDGYVVTAKSNWGSHYPWKAFDRSTSNSDDAWECNDSDRSDSNGNCNTWLQIQLPEAKVANTLYLRERSGKSTRDPKDFTLQASNNGTTWTTLLEQTDQNYTEKTWEFDNETPYTYYRLHITKENQANDNVCIGIMNLMYHEIVTEY